MKRYDLECGYGGGDRLVASVDGAWIRYDDHVEAMKRIAGDSAQQAEPVAWIRMRTLDAENDYAEFTVNQPPANETRWTALYAAPAPSASPADEVKDARDAARYRALRKAGDVSISCDHGDYTQYVESGEELDDLCDNYLSASKEGA